ncbi:MAG: outer membrane lipoprotein-sorting protein [Candidatus Schekmanbacteria bacterium]|nr:outer membrane lipoprotein-sorting protein [Candidatus Schekmanbacteria bacterium]
MKKLAATLLLACALPLALAHSQTPEEKGLEIATAAKKANAGYVGESSEMEMVLINAHGDRTERRMVSVISEAPDDGDKSRIEFLWPADVKGSRMLTWAHKDKDDDQWLFLPAINRTKRIAARNKSGSFMGSEFAYEDLGSQEPEKFAHKLIAEETLGDRSVWKTERAPLNADSGYSREIVWLDKEYMNPTKIEYYDRKGELLKTAIFSDYRKTGQWWRPFRIEMANHQTKKSSVLTWTKRELSVTHNAVLFASDELGS